MSSDRWWLGATWTTLSGNSKPKPGKASISWQDGCWGLTPKYWHSSVHWQMGPQQTPASEADSKDDSWKQLCQIYQERTRWLGVWMDTHLTVKEHHNWCIRKAWATEAQLQLLTELFTFILACVWTEHVAYALAVKRYGREHEWDPKECSWRDRLELLLHWQSSSTLGMLLTTQRGVLVRHSGLTPAKVFLDARQQQRFEATVASTCTCSQSKVLYHYLTPCALVHRVAATEHTYCRKGEMMRWPDPGRSQHSRLQYRKITPWPWVPWTNWQDRW